MLAVASNEFFMSLLKQLLTNKTLCERSEPSNEHNESAGPAQSLEYDSMAIAMALFLVTNTLHGTIPQYRGFISTKVSLTTQQF